MFYMLTLIPTKKQHFIKYKWEKLDKLTWKIELIIFTDFDASMLKIDKKN